MLMLKVSNDQTTNHLAHTHAARTTAAATMDNAILVTCICRAAPVATMSNGDPPPESELESWLLPADVPVLVGAAVGSLNLNVVAVA